MEELEIMLFDFNTSGNTGSSALKAYMEEQKAKGKIDSFKTMRKGNTLQCIIEKGGHMFYAVPEGEQWKVVLAEEGAEYGGVELEVYTNDNVNKDGTFEFNNDKETDVVFYEQVEGDLNFDIAKGVVNIYIYDDMTLTNSGMARSAINIHEGATLNLYLEDQAKMIVDSGYGQNGDSRNQTSTEPAKGGPGGYAGIHVPKTDKGEATFNVYGDGTLIAYGGDAGNGGDGYGHPYGGGRRWPELEQELEAKAEMVEMELEILQN